jgi:L-fuculose-phosphate aldolase
VAHFVMAVRQQVLEKPADEVAATMRRIYRRGLTTASGGNVSVRDTSRAMWITPAGLDKGEVDPDDVVCVEPDGSSVGSHQPSSEMPLHAHIYQARVDVGAVVHAHPVALVAFSVCHRAPDLSVLPDALRKCGEAVSVAYESAGTDRSGLAAGAAFEKGSNCVILENHGAVVVASHCREAFARLECLEFAAQSLAKAAMLGHLHKPGRGAEERPDGGAAGEWSGSPGRGRDRRAALCGFVRRAYERGLIAGGQGGFSVRMDDGSFAITPVDFELEGMGPGDLLRVSIRSDRPRGGAAAVHQAIYAAHAQVNAVIDAAPVNATAFSVTEERLETRTIPESLLLLGEVVDVPYELLENGPGEVAGIVSPQHPAALVRNRGVLIVGASLVDTFDRLEVLEAAAESVIMARSIGDLRPMSDEAVAELRRGQPGRRG